MSVRSALCWAAVLLLAGRAAAQPVLTERKAEFAAALSLPAEWTLDDNPAITALRDSMAAWGDSLTEVRYRYAATVLQANPVLRARGPAGSSAGATVWLSYTPGVTQPEIDTIPPAQFAEMALWRCDATRRQVEASNGTLECDPPTERRIGEWRGLVSYQRLRVASVPLNLRRADVVVPMHGAMLLVVIAVEAGPGDIELLQQIVTTIKPSFTRAGVTGGAP